MEAAIQLAYAFAECGPQHTSIKVDRGAFPTLINTLHATDIADHSHSYVLLAYFDTAVRYLRIATPQSLDRLAAVLTGPRGLRHPELQVRCRAAYCLLRVTEGLEPKSCILLSHVSAFAGTFLFHYSLLFSAIRAPHPVIERCFDLMLSMGMTRQ